MPTYKPYRTHICSGYFADKEGEAGLEYFHESDGEQTVLIFATKYIQLPKEMRVLNKAKVCWLKSGSDLPSIVSRDSIVIVPELDIDQDKLVGVRASFEIKESDKRKYLRRITSTKHKRDLFILDEHFQLLQKAMDENSELELFADKGKRVGFYLIDGSDRIIAYIPEWRPEQMEWEEEKESNVDTGSEEL